MFAEKSYEFTHFFSHAGHVVLFFNLIFHLNFDMWSDNIHMMSHDYLSNILVAELAMLSWL